MMYRSAYDRKIKNRWRIQMGITLLIAFALLSIFDFPLLRLAFDTEHHVQHHDWYRSLRILGFVGTWLAIAIAFALVDRSWKRAGNIILAPIFAGAAAEFLKLLIGRARPVENGQLLEGGYHFRPLFDGFRDGHNLGLPSSHVAVAFGGAFALVYTLPRLRPLVLALAIGCGYTRVAAGAHFPTDIFAGAIVGWIVARAFRDLTNRIHGPSAIPSTAQ